MKRKQMKLMALLLAGAMVFPMTAYAGDASAEGSGEKITLKFWDMVFGSPEYPAEAERLAKSYSEVNPNVEIEYQSIPWANRYETFSVAIASGDGPDVSTGGGYQQHQFAATGNILPLNDIVEEWREEGTLDDFVDGMLEFFQDEEGNQLGIPYNFDPRGIYYRKDVFEEKGLEVPTTWDELYAVVEELTDIENGVYGFVYATSDSLANVGFLSWLISNGGGVWAEDGVTPAWNSEQNKETLEFIASMRDAGFFPENMGSYEQADSEKMFLQGKAMMTMDSLGFGTVIKEQGDDFADKVGIMPWPQGPQSTEIGMAAGMNAYMVYSSTEHPEEAKAFIKWWSENNKELWTGPAQHSCPSARKSFLNDEGFKDSELNPFNDDMLELWMPYLKSTMFPAEKAYLPQVTFDGERWWRDVSQAIVIGEKSIDEILDTKQQAAEDLIADLGLE